MQTTKLQIKYKIFMESEDVSQTRILSCTKDMRDIIANHRNCYINCASVDDENDMEDFILRLFVEQEIAEDSCSNPEQAEQFIDDMVDMLLELAHLHSYMELDGEFEFTYGEEHKHYAFTSESGDSLCDFEER